MFTVFIKVKILFMTSLEKLDYVLRRTKDEWSYKDVKYSFTQSQTDTLDTHTLNLILNKLHRDGYIDFMAGERYVTMQEASDGISIRRNFDGDLFVEAGGYSKQKSDKETIIQDSVLMNQRMERNAQDLVSWTKSLTAATILAAALIVGWEMVKTFWIEGHSFCH